MANFSSIDKLKENFYQDSDGRDADNLIRLVSMPTVQRRPGDLASQPINVDKDNYVFQFSSSFSSDELLTRALYRLRQSKYIKSRQISTNEAESIKQCIDTLKSTQRYKNNPEFIEVCISYGKISDSLSQMFDYMNINEIAKSSSRFYYLWANFLETTLRVDEAKQVVERGIANNAEPKELLYQLRTDLIMRYPVPIRPFKRSIGCVNSMSTESQERQQKKPRIGIFIDEKGASDDELLIDVSSKIPPPLFSKENKTHVDSLLNSTVSHATVASTPRFLDIYEGIEDSSFDTALCSSTLYNMKLLFYRNFSVAIPAFNPGVPKFLRKQEIHSSNANTSLIPSVPKEIRSAVYENHMGMTEKISLAAFGTSGDTEILSLSK